MYVKRFWFSLTSTKLARLDRLSLKSPSLTDCRLLKVVMISCEIFQKKDKMDISVYLGAREGLGTVFLLFLHLFRRKIQRHVKNYFPFKQDFHLLFNKFLKLSFFSFTGL